MEMDVGTLPTAAVIGLPVGGVAVLLFIGWVVYYVKAGRRRGRQTKDQSRPLHSMVPPPPQQQPPPPPGHADLLNKDLGVTVPCLGREEHDSVHRRLTMPSNYLPMYPVSL